MKYRRLTNTGDYSFGSPNQNFIYDINAVGQAIQTRLTLFLDTFWRDLSDGIPMFQRIWGTSASAANLLTVDNIIQQRIRGTEGVTELLSYTSQFNRDTRQYTFEAQVQTIYSTSVIPISGTV